MIDLTNMNSPCKLCFAKEIFGDEWGKEISECVKGLIEDGYVCTIEKESDDVVSVYYTLRYSSWCPSYKDSDAVTVIMNNGDLNEFIEWERDVEAEKLEDKEARQEEIKACDESTKEFTQEEAKAIYDTVTEYEAISDVKEKLGISNTEVDDSYFNGKTDDSYFSNEPVSKVEDKKEVSKDDTKDDACHESKFDPFDTLALMGRYTDSYDVDTEQEDYSVNKRFIETGIGNVVDISVKKDFVADDTTFITNEVEDKKEVSKDDDDYDGFLSDPRIEKNLPKREDTGNEYVNKYLADMDAQCVNEAKLLDESIKQFNAELLTNRVDLSVKDNFVANNDLDGDDCAKPRIISKIEAEMAKKENKTNSESSVANEVDSVAESKEPYYIENAFDALAKNPGLTTEEQDIICALKIQYDKIVETLNLILAEQQEISMGEQPESSTASYVDIASDDLYHYNDSFYSTEEQINEDIKNFNLAQDKRKLDYAKSQVKVEKEKLTRFSPVQEEIQGETKDSIIDSVINGCSLPSSAYYGCGSIGETISGDIDSITTIAVEYNQSMIKNLAETLDTFVADDTDLYEATKLATMHSN